MMKLFWILLLVALPYSSFSQDFTIKVGSAVFPVDKIPDHVIIPDRVSRFSIKKDKADDVSAEYIVQVGEEEQQFPADGKYHEVVFSHDIRGLVVSILDNRRNKRGTPFILNKPE